MKKRELAENIYIICLFVFLIILTCGIIIGRNYKTSTELSSQTVMQEQNEQQNISNNTSVSQKSYDEIYKETDDLQTKYWQIIKKNDILIKTSEYDKNTTTDEKDLSDLFDIAQKRINTNNYYLVKLQEIDKKYKNNTGKAKIEKNVLIKEYNNEVDEILNELYSRIKDTIPTNDFTNLKLSERKWLKDIENYRNVLGSKNDKSINDMNYEYMLINIRRFRILLLIPYLNNVTTQNYKTFEKTSSVQKSDYLGQWDDLYSQRANLEIADLNDFIRAEVNWSSSALENTKWIFECQYDNKSGVLICKNGQEIESYPVKNGKRIYGSDENADYLDEKVTKHNLQTTIKIKKGNLKSTLNKIEYYSSNKEEALNTFKDMTLKINYADLSECVFAKDK